MEIRDGALWFTGQVVGRSQVDAHGNAKVLVQIDGNSGTIVADLPTTIETAAMFATGRHLVVMARPQDLPGLDVDESAREAIEGLIGRLLSFQAEVPHPEREVAISQLQGAKRALEAQARAHRTERPDA